MYGIGHDIYYLASESKQQGNVNYEFGCQTKQKNEQRFASYFMIELNSKDNLIQLQSGLTQNEENKEQSDFIGGIFYSTFEYFAENTKDIFLHSLLQSIYYQNNDYLEAFKNCLNMLQNSFYNSETCNSLTMCKQRMQRCVTYVTQQPIVTASLILKLNRNIYLSKSLKCFDKVQSINYKTSRNSSAIEIDPTKDLIDYSEECFLLKEEVLNEIDQIILSDSLTTPFQKFFNKDIKKMYPLDPRKIRSGHFMHYLKIKLN